MSVRKATKGSEFGDGLVWLWVSLGLTGLPTARGVLLPQDLGIWGALLDVLLYAGLILGLVMLGASVVLIFLSLGIMWAGRTRRGSTRAVLAALVPAIVVLVVASRFVPEYGPTAATAGLVVLMGVATNAAFASLAGRPHHPSGSETTGRGRPGTHG